MIDTIILAIFCVLVGGLLAMAHRALIAIEQLGSQCGGIRLSINHLENESVTLNKNVAGIEAWVKTLTAEPHGPQAMPAGTYAVDDNGFMQDLRRPSK